MEQKKKIKIIIAVLAVLLVLSLSALVGTLVYNKTATDTSAGVTVPDNLITPDGAKPDGNDNLTPADPENAASSAALSAHETPAEAKKAAAIELYNKQPEDNAAFLAVNMFPGDSETKYFRVRVSYHDRVTVHYRADIRKGYEKLAEVMRVRVKFLTTGEIMYDGIMADMPKSLTHKLASRETTSDELYYEITAYLDTSVGNEYQNRELIADFKWWVEETGNLDNSPKTGDTTNIVLWAALAVCSGTAVFLLLLKRKRGEDEENG